MVDTASNIPVWEPFIPTQGSSRFNSFIYCHKKISDDHVIILTEEEDPNYKPPLKQGPENHGGITPLPIPSVRFIRNLVLLDLNKFEYTKIKLQLSWDAVFQEGRGGPFQMFYEDDKLLLSLHLGTGLHLWKFTLSQDYKVIDIEKKLYENFRLTISCRSVLYNKKLWFCAFEQKAEPGGGLFSKKGPYEERLLIADINTKGCIELQTTGPKPVPRFGYSSFLYKNQLFLIGGAAYNQQTPEANLPLSPLSDVWTLDLDTLIWKEITPDLRPIPTISFRLTCLIEDKVYLFGKQISKTPGIYNPRQYLLVYDITNNSWEHIDTDQQSIFDVDKAGTILTYSQGKLIIRDGLGFCRLSLSQLSSNHKNQLSASPCRTGTNPSKDRILFTERPFPDVTFKVEQKEIPAHKAILYSSREFFRNMFTSGSEESNKSLIEIPNIKASVFEAILEYIYCESVEISQDIAWEVLEEAEKYSLPGLKTICEDLLGSCIAVENVVHTINQAEKYGANSLRNTALKYISRNADRVFEEADIHQLKKSTLLEIYKLK